MFKKKEKLLAAGRSGGGGVGVSSSFFGKTRAKTLLYSAVALKGK